MRVFIILLGIAISGCADNRHVDTLTDYYELYPNAFLDDDLKPRKPYVDARLRK